MHDNAGIFMYNKYELAGIGPGGVREWETERYGYAAAGTRGLAV